MVRSGPQRQFRKFWIASALLHTPGRDERFGKMPVAAGLVEIAGVSPPIAT